MPYQPIEKLDTLMGGALHERFRIALAEMLANIRDPNTKPTAARALTMTLTVKPSEDRDSASMEMNVKTKLAPAAPVSKSIFLSYDDNGLATATEKLDQLPGQISLDGEETPLPNVIIFDTKEAKN